MRASSTMLLSAGPLAFWGVWAAWTGLAGGQWILGLVGVVAFATSGGLLRLQVWAKYLAYVFAAGLSLTWICVVSQVASHGWPFRDGLRTVLSLLPGACLLIICAGGSCVVHRQYRSRDV